MEMGVPFGDPYMLGTLGEDDRPYNPTMLSKDFTAFTKMNNFDCSFHDLRHTFATMLIAEGVDVRTVASYLGHASVSMTLDIYADVDPDAKKAAVGKIEEALGTDSLSAPIAPMLDEPHQPRFTANQLRAMLAEAERREDAC
jgi:integrase